MKSKVILFAIVIAAVFMMACGDSGTESPPPGPIDLTAAQKSVIAASNSFAFDIFGQIAGAEDDINIFISPLSMSYALGMTYNGAAGETKSAMGDVLGYGSMSDQEINESYKDLTEALQSIDATVLMEIANSIWCREGFEVEQNFIDLNREYFDAEVDNLDFDDDGSVDIMNGWIADKTHDKITMVIKPPIDPQTVMFLINAIYFNGTWTYEFDEENTETMPFYLTDGSRVDCDMMYQENEFSRYFNDDFQAVELPYGDAGYSMTLFLPRTRHSVDDLIGMMTRENWNTWSEKFTKDTLRFYMPKFRIKYKKSLVDDLKALGMGIAFDPFGADFSGINKTEQLFISDVIHSTFVQVDEKGTEAAAVTVVVVDLSSMPGEERTMLVNRPFIFVIHDKYTNTIMFMGKIVEPVWED